MASPRRCRYAAPVRPFVVSHRDALAHGVIAGVGLPGTGEPVPEAVLARLHDDERALARGMRGYRQESFVGGRLAAAAALELLGHGPAAVGIGARGEPLAPPGVTLSITHKRHHAVAIAARADHGDVGIDLEDLKPERMGIASRVLRADELAAVEALPRDRQWTATVTRFALKEAVYKALAPRVQRFIGFEEAELDVGMDGRASVRLFLDPPGPPVHLDARYAWLAGGVLATVRAEWADRQPAPDLDDEDPSPDAAAAALAMVDDDGDVAGD